MNPLISNLLGGILHSITGADTPTANPGLGAAYNFDTGQYEVGGVPVDSDIQAKLAKAGITSSPVARQPYQDPSFWMKALNPSLASGVTEANITGQEAAVEQQQQHDITQGITAKDFGQVKNATATPISDLSNTQGAILYPNPTAQNLQFGNENIPRNIIGLPSKEATTTYQAEEAKSRQLAAESILGQPEASAWENYVGSLAGGAGNINKNLYSLYTRPYIPAEATAEGTGAQYQAGMNQAKIAALPSEARQLINTDYVAAGLSDVDRANLPTMQDTRQSAIRTAAREASYPPTMGNPLYVTLKGQVARNPLFGGLIQSMNAKLGNTGGTNPIPLGNGLNIVPDNSPAGTNSPDMGTNSPPMPQRQVRTPISPVPPITAQVPATQSDDYVRHPITMISDLLHGLGKPSTGGTPEQWQSAIDAAQKDNTLSKTQRDSKIANLMAGLKAAQQNANH